VIRARRRLRSRPARAAPPVPPFSPWRMPPLADDRHGIVRAPS
jgi:hypothetical protein